MYEPIFQMLICYHHLFGSRGRDNSPVPQMNLSQASASEATSLNLRRIPHAFSPALAQCYGYDIRRILTSWSSLETHFHLVCVFAIVWKYFDARFCSCASGSVSRLLALQFCNPSFVSRRETISRHSRRYIGKVCTKARKR